MNRAKRCHRMGNIPHLYVDAFRAFQEETEDERNTFILTHYHSDHYTGLPRNNAYKGPAKIHCTPITAQLLVEVHGISSEFVCSHKLGEVWYHSWEEKEDEHVKASASSRICVAEMVFYCANHCPGAALTLARMMKDDAALQFANGNFKSSVALSAKSISSVHVHCGDFRFNEGMKEYALLKESVNNCLVDNLYLDTTYSSPKHIFCPQEEAVNTIASQIEAFLTNTLGQRGKTLVLLSCYSIGKEKLLVEACRRIRGNIYANEQKRKLLKCTDPQFDFSLADRLTTDPKTSALHVVPMGLAGKMFPFFVPNFESIYKYVDTIAYEDPPNRVVAIIPTGFADASSYNRKHSMESKTVNGMRIETRTYPYSEHSSYSELLSFVEFCKPMHVVPTVFSSDKEYAAIEKRFHKFTDKKRALRAFFEPRVGVCRKSTKMLCNVEKKRKPQPAINDDQLIVYEGLNQLLSMGFSRDASISCLRRCNGHVNSAIEMLLTS